MLNVGKVIKFYNHLRGDGHIGSHLAFQVVMITCLLSFIETVSVGGHSARPAKLGIQPHLVAVTWKYKRLV